MNNCQSFITTIILTMYILQGIPFGLQENYISNHYKHLGLEFSQVSLLQLVILPRISRILVAPFVDKIKQKHFVVTLCLFLIGSVYFYIEGNSSIRLTLMISNIFIAIQDVILDFLVMSNMDLKELVISNLAQLVGCKLGMIIGNQAFGQSWSFTSIFATISLFQLCTSMMALIFLNIRSEVKQSEPQEVPPTKSWDITSCSPDNEESLHQAVAHVTHSAPITAVEGSTENVRLRNAVIEAQAKKNNSQYLSLSEAYGDIRDEKTTKLSKHSEFCFYVTELLHNRIIIWTIVFVLTYKLGELGALTYFPIFLIDAGIAAATVHWWNSVACQLAFIMGCIICTVKLSRNKLDVFSNLWLFSCARIVVMFALLVLVLKTNERINENKNKTLFLTSIGLLMTLSFISGALKTIAFLIMKITCKPDPLKKQAFHYNILAIAELLGKLLMSLSWEPTIDLFGEHLAFTTYFLLNLAAILVLVQFPKRLQHKCQSSW